MKNRIALILCAVLVVVALSLPVNAQSDVSGALATLAAATTQAQYRRQAMVEELQKQAIRATEQHIEIQATESAQRTEATTQAADRATLILGITATRQSIEVEATRTAIETLRQAEATRYSQDAQATRVAYNIAIDHQYKRDAAFTIWMCIVVCCLAIVGVYTLYIKLKSQAMVIDGVVVEVSPSMEVGQLLLPAPKNYDRSIDIKRIDDERIVRMARKLWDSATDGE